GALLTAGAQEQVDVGHVRVVEMPREAPGGDAPAADPAGPGILRDRTDRVDDLGATAVVHAHVQRHPGVRAGELLRLAQLLDDAAPQPLLAADPDDAHAPGVQRV